MNEYLESLVKKSELSEEPVTNEIEDEVATEDNNNESEVQSAEVTVNPEVETPEIEITVETEDSSTASVEEEVVETESEEHSSGATVISENNFNIGDIIKVENEKIYSTPDVKSQYRLITGNIEYIGVFNDFDVVVYVKPGFGAIKGYAKLTK